MNAATNATPCATPAQQFPRKLIRREEKRRWDDKLADSIQAARMDVLVACARQVAAFDRNNPDEETTCGGWAREALQALGLDAAPTDGRHVYAQLGDAIAALPAPVVAAVAITREVR